MSVLSLSRSGRFDPLMMFASTFLPLFFLVAWMASMLGGHAPPALAYYGQKAATAATSQLLSTNTPTTVTNNADRFYPLGYSAAAAAADFKSMVFPFSGKITKITVYMFTAPGVGGSWAWTLMVNNSASLATCTVLASTSECTATFSPGITVTAGQWASIRSRPAGSPTTSQASVLFTLVPDNPNDSILMAQASTFLGSSVTAVYPFLTGSGGTTGNRQNFAMPDGGTIDKLQVITTAPGLAASGKQYDFSFSKNNSVIAAASFGCNVLETATSCNDPTRSFSVAVPSGASADDIAFSATPTSTPNASTAGLGARFVATTSGGFVWAQPPNGATDSATVETFYPLNGGLSGTTETNSQTRVDSMTVKRITVKLVTAPGVGKARDFIVRDNLADTACIVTISGTATVNSANCSVSISAGHFANYVDRPSAAGGGSPATSATPNITIVATR